MSSQAATTVLLHFPVAGAWQRALHLDGATVLSSSSNVAAVIVAAMLLLGWELLLLHRAFSPVDEMIREVAGAAVASVLLSAAAVLLLTSLVVG